MSTNYEMKTNIRIGVSEIPVVRLPKELKIRAGERLKIEGTVQGKPFPSSYWMRNDAVLNENEKFMIQQTGSTNILTIKKAVRGDTDEYVLRAENAHGKAQALVKVDVLGMCAIYFNKFPDVKKFST